MTVNKSVKKTSAKQTSAGSTTQQSTSKTSKTVSSKVLESKSSKISSEVHESSKKVSSGTLQSSKGNVSKSSSASSLQIADVSHLPINSSNVTYTVTEVLPAGGGEKVTTYETGGATSTEYRHFITQDKSGGHSTNIQQIDSTLNQSTSNISVDSASTYTVTEPKEEYRLTYNMNDSGWNGKFIMEGGSSTTSSKSNTTFTKSSSKNVSSDSKAAITSLDETYIIDNSVRSNEQTQDSRNISYDVSNAKLRNGKIVTTRVDSKNSAGTSAVTMRDKNDFSRDSDRRRTKVLDKGKISTQNLSSSHSTVDEQYTNIGNNATAQSSSYSTVDEQYTNIGNNATAQSSSKITTYYTDNESSGQKSTSTESNTVTMKDTKHSRGTTGWNGKFIYETVDNTFGNSKNSQNVGQSSKTTSSRTSKYQQPTNTTETFLLSEINENILQNQRDGFSNKNSVIIDSSSHDHRTNISKDSKDVVDQFILTEIYDNVEKYGDTKIIRDNNQFDSRTSSTIYRTENSADLKTVKDNSKIYTDERYVTDKYTDVSDTTKRRVGSPLTKRTSPSPTRRRGTDHISTIQNYGTSTDTVDYKSSVVHDSQYTVDQKYASDNYTNVTHISDGNKEPTGRRPASNLSPSRRTGPDSPRTVRNYKKSSDTTDFTSTVVQDSAVVIDEKYVTDEYRNITGTTRKTIGGPRSPSRRKGTSPSPTRRRPVVDQRSSTTYQSSDTDISNFTTTIIQDSKTIIDEKYITDSYTDVSDTSYVQHPRGPRGPKGPRDSAPSPTRRRPLGKQFPDSDTTTLVESYETFTNQLGTDVTSEFISDTTKTITENIIEQEITRDIREFQNEIHRIEDKLNDTTILTRGPEKSPKDRRGPGGKHPEEPIRIIDAVEHVDITVSDIITGNEEKSLLKWKKI
ncbi:hypothetical protein WA026_018563 [Henosepilachna vigintioctopunctata]|uniref:Uncharacterized protein n=1 Tax=Henosepilachna vigintioctopunctata TaxID=420089 RepID=A0AAW1U124_9CUCU